MLPLIYLVAFLFLSVIGQCCLFGYDPLLFEDDPHTESWGVFIYKVIGSTLVEKRSEKIEETDDNFLKGDQITNVVPFRLEHSSLDAQK